MEIEEDICESYEPMQQCSVTEQVSLSTVPLPVVEDGFEKQLKQLEHEDSVTTSIKDKENEYQTKQSYAFTPDTVDSSLNWPYAKRYAL